LIDPSQFETLGCQPTTAGTKKKLGDTPAFRGGKAMSPEDEEPKKIDFEEKKVKEFSIPDMPKIKVSSDNL
jgi:hypothetical protein